MSKTLFGRRRTVSPSVLYGGGQRSGVVVADPGGRATVLPYSGSTGDTLDGTGAWSSGGGGGGGLVPLFDGGEPPVIISDGAGTPILVDV
jgi:hypothetical protein